MGLHKEPTSFAGPLGPFGLQLLLFLLRAHALCRLSELPSCKLALPGISARQARFASSVGALSCSKGPVECSTVLGVVIQSCISQ